MIVVSKLLGYIREFFLVYLFGASVETDAYLLASVVPQLLFSTIDLAFAAILIPLLLELKKLDKTKLPGFVSVLTLCTTIILTVVTILGIFFSNSLLNMVAFGAESKVKELAIILSQILMPMIILQGVIQISIAVLRIYDKPVIGNFIGIPYNLIIMLGMLAFKDSLGIYGVSIFVLIGVFAQMLVLLIYCMKLGMFGKFKFSDYKQILLRTLLLGVPTLYSTFFSQIQVIVERLLASSLETGTITIVYYINKLFTLIVFILITLINSLVFPKMGEWAITNDKKKYELKLNKLLRLFFLILILLTVITFINSNELIKIILQNGKLTSEDIRTIIIGFQLAVLGLSGYILKDILTKVFFSYQRVKIATNITVCSTIINAILSIILTNYYGVFGIIVSTPITTYLTVLISIYFIKTKLNIRIKLMGNKLLYLLVLGISTILIVGNGIIKMLTLNTYIILLINIFFTILVAISIYFYVRRRNLLNKKYFIKET